jgi:hypothetical protein
VLIAETSTVVGRGKKGIRMRFVFNRTAAVLSALLLAGAAVVVIPASPAMAASSQSCDFLHSGYCYTPEYDPPGTTLSISVNTHCFWQSARWHVFDADTQVTVAEGTTSFGESYKTVSGLYGKYQGYVYTDGSCGVVMVLSQG